MFARSLRDDVSQGDIFRSVTFARVDVSGEETTTTVRKAAGMLLTFDCEYDKPRVDYVLFAPLRPLSEASKENQGNIRARRVRSSFYVEEVPARFQSRTWIFT